MWTPPLRVFESILYEGWSRRGYCAMCCATLNACQKQESRFREPCSGYRPLRNAEVFALCLICALIKLIHQCCFSICLAKGTHLEKRMSSGMATMSRCVERYPVIELHGQHMIRTTPLLSKGPLMILFNEKPSIIDDCAVMLVKKSILLRPALRTLPTPSETRTGHGHKDRQPIEI